jgi:hypothetical protein
METKFSRRELISGATFAVVAARCRAQGPTRSSMFELYQGMWMNLHHFLYQLGAVNEQAGNRGRVPHAAALDAAAKFASLSTSDQSVWESVVSTYRRLASPRDLLNDNKLISDALSMSRVPDDAALEQTVSPELRSALESAAPIYRRTWWPTHLETNSAFRRELETLIEKHGRSIQESLTALYGFKWPAGGFRVGLTMYANWAGGYSTRRGLIVVSSSQPSNAGTQGLEVIFHEALHQGSGFIDGAFRRGSKQLETTVPAQLSHSLIFYTVGYVMSQVIDGHQPYAVANGLWMGTNLVARDLLDSYWLPYLKGQVTLDTAVNGLLQAAGSRAARQK